MKTNLSFYLRQTPGSSESHSPCRAEEITMHDRLSRFHPFPNPLTIPSTVLFVVLFSLSATGQLQNPNTPPDIVALKIRAESGNAIARHSLFNFLSQSDSTAPGHEMALDWLRSLATQNQPDALYLFGYLYEHGRGLPRDYAKAAENYHAAAVQGNNSAQNNLASLYQHGLGVPKNVGKAFDLYFAAAQQGNPVAQCNLASMYFTGSGTPLNLSEAARWFRAAADLGNPAAQHNLAVMYFKGIGVTVDSKEALRFERLAAEQGYSSAESDLAYFYETGKGVPLDYVMAYAWYSRAIAGGDRVASDRRKSLARLMTLKQLGQANNLVPH